MPLKTLLPAVFAALLLSACAGPQNSVDRNARHTAFRLAQTHFDPNTRPLVADNARLMAQFLSQFYALGKKDREAGLTQRQAQQRVASFNRDRQGVISDDTPFAPGQQKSQIINHEYEADRPEKRSEILLEGATATYWDGYNGRP
ncbi:Exc2 family lipoprotein [Pantoea sp. FN060301]|uniref:Exc2 family lipoprotein n=1 Tax=Pantoea sp. FN060301 TaxID=3420380 RepID=UPI003D165AE0